MDNCDDSYISKIHKDALVKCVLERITKNPDYEAFDNSMIETLCKDLYVKTINGMNKEQYLREIEEEEERVKNPFSFKPNPSIKGVILPDE